MTINGLNSTESRSFICKKEKEIRHTCSVRDTYVSPNTYVVNTQVKFEAFHMHTI